MLQVWIDEWYHKRPHDSLKGMTPETAFKCDKRPLQFADPKLLRDAFRYSQKAKVDKIGCLKFHGQVYEAGFAFIGRTVEVLYTPESLDQIEVLCKGLAPVIAKPLEIDAFPRPQVVLVIGVNGSGKTTTIAKLAHLFMEQDYGVMLAAALLMLWLGMRAFHAQRHSAQANAPLSASLAH